jgi:hypothetical protein
MPNATASEFVDQYQQAPTLSLAPYDSAAAVTHHSDIGNTEHSVNEEPLTGVFNTGGLDLGDMDDFFEFGSWF